MSSLPTTSLQGRVYWITGASGALGLALAHHLRAQGAQLVLSARHPVASADDDHWLPLDVTDRAAVDAAAHTIAERHGRLDGVVSCTTAPAFGDFTELDDDAWRTALDVKLLGAVRVVRAALPLLQAQPQSRVILISGRGGTEPPLRHLPGACANAALNLLVQGLASRLGADGIRCNAVAPGPVSSPRLDAMQQAGVGSRHNALGTLASAEDIAQAIGFLLSDQAQHIHGTVLHIDGGRAVPR